MRLQNVTGVEPQKDLVVVDIQPRETEGLYLGGNEQASKTQVELYYGIVEALGPQVDEDTHCPGLIQGDIAIFSQFAGSYIATNDNKLHKVIRGYDIMATTTELNKTTKETITPTADRLLVESLKKDTEENGLVLNEEDSRDPRLADISYGYVIKKGPSTNSSLEVGELIGFDNYVGEIVRHRASDDLPELKVIREDDILFIKR